MSHADTVKVTLTKPVTFGEGDNAVVYKELTFREATIGDMIQAETISKGDVGRVAALLAVVSGTPFPAIQKIKLSDMNVIISKAGHLVGNEVTPPTAGAA